jgi:2-oxoglutarate dehydrogenase E1 component
MKAVSPELDYKYYGFTEADLEKEFTLKFSNAQGIFANQEKWKLGDLLRRLGQIYCGKMGIERGHVSDSEATNWLIGKMEADPNKAELLKDKKVFFEGLQYSSLLEEFFHLKYTTTKRFSASGSDSLVPCLKLIINQAIDMGVDKVIIGLSHRGRINAMAYLLHKEIAHILGGFQGTVPQGAELEWGNSGDVKYHLGCMYKYKNADGRTIEIQLMPNASHLESVDPLTAGRVRAEQDLTGDTQRKKVLGILVHGDAAFSGQGVVYETLQFADLAGYNCGGTVHVVVNNQIGFTTVPKDSRTGSYCTEIAKSIMAPIVHVNSEDAEGIIKSSQMAVQYRQQFGKDFVIDLVGYRLYGHNEMDQPMFTQPIMYKKIQSMRRIYDMIIDKYVAEGVYTKAEIENMATNVKKEFEKGFTKAKNLSFKWEEWRPKVSYRYPLPFEGLKNTGIKVEELRKLNEKINVIPKDYVAHPLVRKVYEARYKAIKDGVGIDWATGEALAFATLLKEGHHIRISGQDVQRGTFSHRHSYVHNQDRDEVYVPLKNISEKQGQFNACNSSLSELAVLGFEIGYQYADPNALVMWEGQFGDFANGAQIMIDQYIASGEAKWGVQNGIVLSLPHGYDGQGSEHSSARLERYLQMADDDPYSCRLTGHLNRETNWQIIDCTTPANYFHALRRQLRRDYRKPLVVMAPKRLLRLRDATSNIEEFGEGKRFRVLIPEVNKDIVEPKKVEKLILCSGQVYYDLIKARSEFKKKNIAIVRIEQIAPFPIRQVLEQFDQHSNARIIWCQEEHFNMGAWSFVEPRANKVYNCI